MKTLNLKSLMRNLALMGAGAFMATLIILPLTTSADNDDDQDDYIDPKPRVVTYTLRDSEGHLAKFTLTGIGRDGNQVLTLHEKIRRPGRR